jgi:hypothetical protein
MMIYIILSHRQCRRSVMVLLLLLDVDNTKSPVSGMRPDNKVPKGPVIWARSQTRLGCFARLALTLG